MTINLSQVGNTQSFGTWLQRTNDLVVAMGANVVTVDTTVGGSVSTGNAFVNGIFGSNTLYVTNIIAGNICLLYTSPSPRDGLLSRMPSSA